MALKCLQSLKSKWKRGKKECPKPNPPDQPAPPTPAPSSTTASAAPSSSPPPAPAASSQPVSPDTAPTIQSLPERLWNRAYDDLKEEESGLVDTYEKLLSRELEGDPSSTDLTSQKNKIEQKNPEMRRDQMSRLVTDGLEKIERETKIKGNIEEGMQPLSSAKGVIDTVVKAYPEASLAWAGVCCALQMLANPITETRANREGIAYVVSRMEWYWQLSRSLLDENRDDGKSAGLRDELEKHVIDLYKTLLSYQMKSVYSYYRSRHVVFWRDVIKLDDWAGTLEAVHSAENTVREDSAAYSTESIKTHLDRLAKTAKSLEEKLLPGFRQALQEQTAAQSEMRQGEKDERQEEKNKECLADLHTTDPRDDKERIKQTKGGLLKDSSNWILKHEDFERWYNNDEARLLWIKGDPGKGKTMLLIAIVDELEQRLNQPHQQPTTVLSYFFCQGTNSNLNNATAVLRGLIYLLGVQNPSLLSHLRKRYDTTRSKLFEGTNVFFSLSKVLEDMLREASLSRAYIVIDALDECEKELPQLLKFIAENSSASSCVKWIVSSRNRPEIEQQLKLDDSGIKLSLELTQNAEQVAYAVNAYIDVKISKLPLNDDDKVLVRDTMHQKANGTFLWVALVVHKLENVKSWHVLQVVEELPAGLKELYARMIKYIQQLERDSEFCRRILSTVTLAYQPLRLAELGVLSGLPNEITGSTNNIRDIVAMCGSFLTIQGGYVYLIHQSAKDYLSGEASSKVFPSGPTDVHHTIFSWSLQAMSTTLHRDIYNLRHPGLLIGEIKAPDPDPLVAIRYSCVHWISHFCDACTSSRPEVETIGQFLREKFLYWLEALGLIQHMRDRYTYE
ncbi:NACHT domain-containing protein [Xylaria arbuscula]|nr:NACHT domain-containing protein [Xylaria arbuscula]